MGCEPDLNDTPLKLYDILKIIDSWDIRPSKRRKTTVYSRSLSEERGRKSRQPHKVELDEERSPLARSQSLDQGKDIYRGHWEGELFEPGLVPVSDTGPESIARLWESVRMANSDEGVATRTRSRKTTSDTRSNSIIIDSVKESGYREGKRNSPYNSDFDKKVLQPRSILIDRKGISVRPYFHFGTDQPNQAMTQADYCTVSRGATKSTIWVEDDQEFLASVARRYTVMKRRQSSEAEFASYAREKLLKQDDFLFNQTNDHKGEWKAERLIEQMVIREQGANWESPPILGDPGEAHDLTSGSYAFDLKPDSSYWLSTQAFNIDYRRQIEDYVYVLHEELTCPYLTVEFKRDNLPELRAIWQVAAAGSVALYNRFLLKQRRIKDKKLSEKLTKIVRHYGLTLSGHEFTVWCIEPLTSEDQWAGCKMTRIGHGYCDRAEEVRQLVHWINEIHCWGLTVYGPRCEKDIKILMHREYKKTKSSGATIDMR